MRHNERGVTALEFVLITPVLIAAMLFAVGVGRIAHARQQVESLAADAARAASLERDIGASAAAGDAMASQSAGHLGLSCSPLAVAVDVTDYEPGGVVTATVTCEAQLRDLGLVGFPGTKTFLADAAVPIENYRSN